jgi:hypothetical protein
MHSDVYFPVLHQLAERAGENCSWNMGPVVDSLSFDPSDKILKQQKFHSALFYNNICVGR